jgi:hypothetical protein
MKSMCNSSMISAGGQWVPSADKDMLPKYDSRVQGCAVDTKWKCPLHTWAARWEPPASCGPLPTFDIDRLHEMLKGGSILFVGDSLMRQQHLSLVCMISASNHTGKHMMIERLRYEVQNYLVNASQGTYGEYVNGTKILHWEHVLVEQPILEPEWFHSHIAVVFGVGQHFLHPGNKYWLNNGTAIHSSIVAHNTALRSVRNQLCSSAFGVCTHQKQLLIYYRTFSPDHFYGGWYYSSGRCSHIRFNRAMKEPTREYSQGTYLENHTDDMRRSAVAAFERSNIHVLDITAMSSARGDMHRATWENSKKREDCVHWCMGGSPSIPDYWNLLLVHQMSIQLRLN